MVEYLPIRINKTIYGGAKVTLDKAQETFILFRQASTFFYQKERYDKLKPQQAKQMQLLLFDTIFLMPFENNTFSPVFKYNKPFEN